LRRWEYPFLNLVKTIFSIITPVSNHLQPKSIDFIKAINLVDIAKNQLIDFRDDSKCQHLINEAKNFTKDQNLTERNFKEVKLRKKMYAWELSTDEISSTAQDVFRSDVYFIILDVIIFLLNFDLKTRKIMKDLCLHSPERLLDFCLIVKSSKQLPEEVFDYLANWIRVINLHNLRVFSFQ